jgi:hypothetical protein
MGDRTVELVDGAKLQQLFKKKSDCDLGELAYNVIKGYFVSL